jgi:hypothetical protein
MRQFWDLLYRDRRSRVIFAVMIAGFIGPFLLDIWPRVHPHYSIRDWIVFACTYWAGSLTALSIVTALRLILRNARGISARQH